MAKTICNDQFDPTFINVLKFHQNGYISPMLSILINLFSFHPYQKGQSNEKKIAKDYFGFLLHLLFHDYSGLVYDLTKMMSC
jgi:hypothetical protein